MAAGGAGFEISESAVLSDGSDVGVVMIVADCAGVDEAESTSGDVSSVTGRGDGLGVTTTGGDPLTGVADTLCTNEDEACGVDPAARASFCSSGSSASLSLFLSASLSTLSTKLYPAEISAFQTLLSSLSSSVPSSSPTEDGGLSGAEAYCVPGDDGADVEMGNGIESERVE